MKSGMYLLPLVFSSRILAFSLVNFSFNDNIDLFAHPNHDHPAFCPIGVVSMPWLWAVRRNEERLAAIPLQSPKDTVPLTLTADQRVHSDR